jgi:hypothetical protein
MTDMYGADPSTTPSLQISSTCAWCSPNETAHNQPIAYGNAPSKASKQQGVICFSLALILLLFMVAILGQQALDVATTGDEAIHR